MTDKELEIFLIERCNAYDLKKSAFDSLDEIFLKHSNDNEFLCGFERNEIKTIFEGFDFQVERRYGSPIIRTRIGLYVEDKDQIAFDNLESIGYYELDSNLNGEVVDDWLVIEKQKYLKDIEIINLFQKMNDKLPIEYLRRNHIQYAFVSYISLVCTLFISKQFEGSGRFVKRAYTNLEEIGIDKINKEYLIESKYFLNTMRTFLVTNNLVSENLKQELIEIKNCG